MEKSEGKSPGTLELTGASPDVGAGIGVLVCCGCSINRLPVAGVGLVPPDPRFRPQWQGSAAERRAARERHGGAGPRRPDANQRNKPLAPGTRQ